MLNVNDIAARIANPLLTKESEATDFKALAEKYPYTQLFSILYLRALKQAGDIHFEDELKKHSFRISDRVQLYELIEGAKVSDQLIIEETIEAPVPIVEVPISEVIEAVQEPIEIVSEEVEEQPIVEETPISTEIGEEILADIVEIVDETPADSEFLTENVETEPEENTLPASEEISELPATETVSPAEIVVELEPIVEPLETTAFDEGAEDHLDSREWDDIEQDETVLESTEDEGEPELYSIQDLLIDDPVEEMDPLDQAIAHHVYAANYQLEGLTPEEELALDKNRVVSPIPDKEKTDFEEKKSAASFTSWLHANRNYSEPESDTVGPPVVPHFSEFDPSKSLFGEHTRPKQEFFSAPKKAKKSLTEEALPVSETLAKVYSMQGNYPKAIAAYQQLMLTIPEKKSFFASLIVELKTKLNT